jgi:hypothetical protein
VPPPPSSVPVVRMTPPALVLPGRALLIGLVDLRLRELALIDQSTRIGRVQRVARDVPMRRTCCRHRRVAGQDIDGPRRSFVVQLRVFPDAVSNISSCGAVAGPAQWLGHPEAGFGQAGPRFGEGGHDRHSHPAGPTSSRCTPPHRLSGLCHPNHSPTAQRTLRHRCAGFDPCNTGLWRVRVTHAAPSIRGHHVSGKAAAHLWSGKGGVEHDRNENHK